MIRYRLTTLQNSKTLLARIQHGNVGDLTVFKLGQKFGKILQLSLSLPPF